ncbi:MAG: cell wall-binding repeat-containing protein [Bacillota bacterium]|nr:cell wall-binding repeat-containing protein [Bacillota bacterium]
MKLNKTIIFIVLSVFLCSSLIVVSPGFVNASTSTSFTRLSGQTRFETSEAIAEQFKPGKVQTVILATGNGFADALSASVLAHQLDAPILLVDSSVDSSQCAFDYVTQHLAPTGTVYIIGGTGIINADFEVKLKSLGFKNIVRVAGNDRYDTSYQLARSLNDSSISTVVISSGESYPDALSIASFAANKGWPILLSAQNALTEKMKGYILEKKPSKVYITGGAGVISENIQSEIVSLLPQTSIERLTGQTQFDTNVIIAETFAPKPSTVYLTTGYGFADALAGSVVAATNGDPIIFIDPSQPTLPKSTASYFEKFYSNVLNPTLVSFGGTGVVTDNMMGISRDLIWGTLKSTSIYSIADITATITQNDRYPLPTTVEAKLYNGDTMNVPVHWNSTSADTSSAGLCVYDGVVDGYGRTIKLNLYKRLSGITVSGRSATLIDVGTGATLFSKNPTNQEYPASITKLMTALLVYKSEIPLSKSIEIGDSIQDSNLWDTTLMGLKQGDSITLGDLLAATLLGSFNDGANALAQATTGSMASFVDAMNAEASALGMRNTHFANPSGLTDVNHYTTAEDMAIMARYIVTNYPQILDITARPSINVCVNGNWRTIKNINHIIEYNTNILGLKTGYTHAADNTIIALVKVGNKEVIAVILKSPGYALYNDAYKLLSAGINP